MNILREKLSQDDAEMELRQTEVEIMKEKHCHVYKVRVKNMTGSSLDDWIY
jgi:hypothetical protein